MKLRPTQKAMRVAGHKSGGGGSGRTPREDPDSLHNTAFLRLKEVVSEGEIVGPRSGLANILKDVFLNGTPIQNEDGTINYPDVRVDFRPGTQNQDPMPGFPASEVTRTVGIELTPAQPFTQAITNGNVSAVRVNVAWAGLSKRNQSNGDINGYRIEYAVDVSTNNSPFAEVAKFAVDGKTTQRYARSHRIELPRNGTSWAIRVRRITPLSNTQNIQEVMAVDSIVEVVDANLRNPMSAMIGMVIDAKTFPSPPTRAYRFRGRILEIPSNYNPDTREYVGTWDGTFKLGWTNCPPWILRDVIVNDRYGLGDVIDRNLVNRYSLYRIAQYCDERVPDGKGGMEPRFTCNVYIQTADDAMRVVQSLSSVFRGASYWSAGSIATAADMPTDDLYTFTNAGVIGGVFQYKGTGRKSRYTVALVSYSDQTDFGRQKVIAVEDEDGISRYGLNQTDISAFACTSPGQAFRAGQWLLMSSQVETEGASWKIALERVLVMPGRVVRVADKHRAGRRIGGRIRSASTTEVVMDAARGIRAGESITVNLPSGLMETRQIQSYTVNPATPGQGDTVRVASPFSEVPEAESQWGIESPELNMQRFRILGLTYLSNMEAEVLAIKHVPGKYNAIDFNTRLSTAPITVIPSASQKAPADLRVNVYSSVDQNIETRVAVFEWAPAPNAVQYELDWRRDNSDWIKTPGTATTRYEVRDIYSGNYMFRVRAINALGASSNWAYSVVTPLTGALGDPPALGVLTTASLVMGIRVDWAFQALPAAIDRTEIWYSTTPSLSNAIKLGDFAYPQNTHTIMGLSHAVQFYFWGRVVAKSGDVGPFYPVGNGVPGKSSNDVSLILEFLAGQIGETQLGQAIKDQIKLIEINYGRILAEIGINDANVRDLVDQGKDLASQIGDLSKDSLARYNELIGQVNAVANNAAANAAAISAEAAASVARTQTLRTELTQTISQLQGEVASILGTEEYQASKQYVLGDLVTYNNKLFRAKRTSTGVTPANGADWELLGDYSSIGQAVADLGSRVATVEGVSAGLTTRMQAAETKDSQLTAQITSLQQTQVGFAQTLNTLSVSNAENTSKISTLQQASAEAVSRLDSFDVEIDGVKSNVSTLTQASEGQAQQLTSLGVIVGQNSSAIENLDQVTDGHAESIQQLNVRDGELSAGIQNVLDVTAEQATAISNLVAKDAEIENKVTTISQASDSQALMLARLQSVYGDSDALITTISRTQQGLAQRQEVLRVKAEAAESSIIRLDSVTATSAGAITQLQTDTGAISNRTTTLEETSTQYAQRISTVETRSQDSASKVVTLTQTTDALVIQGTQLTQKNATQDQSISTLNQISEQYSIMLAQMLAFQGDMDGGFTQIRRVQAGQVMTSEILSARTANNTASISTINQLITDNQGSTATSISQIIARADAQQVTIGQIDGKVTQNIAAITGETTARATADEALTIRINNAFSGIDGVSAAIQQESTTRASAIEGLAQTINTVSSQTTIAKETADQAVSSAATANQAATAAQGTANTAVSNAATAKTAADQAAAAAVTANNAAAAAAGIAEGKGKVIIQAAAPAAADRLPQNLWIDTTGNLNTPKRWLTNQWVAVTDQAAKDAATAAANAQATATNAGTAAATAKAAADAAQQTANTGVSNAATAKQAADAAASAAQAAAGLAGSKGKVIIQTGRPPAADELAQNLWIDTGSGLNAPKRWTGSAWQAVTDKAATDAAAAAVAAQATANTAVANAATAQSTAANAATAAANAAGLAGSKGKVIIQSAAPDAEDRKVQNLWIDTTGGANTPKRWTSGTTWAAVTDKVAQDAANVAAAAKAAADAANAGLVTLTAAVNQEITTRTNENQAFAQTLTTVQSSIGQNSAAIALQASTLVTLEGALNAQGSFKLEAITNGTRYVTGMYLGLEVGPGGVQSQILFQAGRWGVINPSTNGISIPFIVSNGQTIIDDALIRQLDAAKITFGYMHGDRIAVHSIWADRIDTGSFNTKVAEIDFAYIERANIHWASVDYLRIAGQSATVWSQFYNGGMYVDKEQANYQLFGFYTYNVPDWSDAVVMLNAWQDMGSSNFSYSKAYIYRIKHEQTGTVYEGIPSASQPRTFGVNSGQCVTLSFPNLPPGDQSFTVFCKPDQSTWAGGIPGQSPTDAQNPENPGRVSNAYSTIARFRMSVLSRMR